MSIDCQSLEQDLLTESREGQGLRYRNSRWKARKPSSAHLPKGPQCFTTKDLDNSENEHSTEPVRSSDSSQLWTPSSRVHRWSLL